MSSSSLPLLVVGQGVVGLIQILWPFHDATDMPGGTVIAVKLGYFALIFPIFAFKNLFLVNSTKKITQGEMFQ